MKQTLFLLVAVFTIGLVNSTTLYGDTYDEIFGEMLAQADTSQSSDWDALFDDDQPGRDAQKPQGQRGPRGEGFGRGPRQGPGHDGPPHSRRGQGGPGGQGGYGTQIEPQALLDFLHEHEPQLAQKLENLKDESPRKARRLVRRLARLYTMIMRQMERNPEMGKLSLQRVRISLRVKNQLRQSKKESVPIDSAQLRQNVAELYDIILTQEELRIRQMTARMEKWGNFEGQDRREGSGREKGRMREGRKHLEEMEASLKSWRSHKKLIIDRHIQRLQNGIKPFPWGRM